MITTNFSPWPSYTDAEIRAVSDVLLSNRVNYWTGTECREFENEFALVCGVKYAIALSNGTLALDLALKCLNICPGDEVVVTPRTFIASVSSIVNCGAIPVFADVDSRSGNITADTISEVLSTRTKAIICVHLAGWPCDMNPIMELANARGIKVIEDCAQAHGSKYKGRSVGSIGHIGAWSFCQDKIITTGGEGGMVTTNDEYLWRSMWSFKDHGKSFDAVYRRSHPPGFRWVHESFGSNFRMMELQAVLGRIQLKRLSGFTEARTQNAQRIFDVCRKFPSMCVPDVICNSCSERCTSSGSLCDCVHAYYKCYVYLNPDKLSEGWSRDKIIDEFNRLGVPCYQGTCSEVYLEKAFDNTQFKPKDRLPVAKRLGETSLMFLVHPTLTDLEIEMTCSVIAEIMTRATANINSSHLDI